MRELLEQTLEESRTAIETEFLGRQRIYLRGLEVKKLEKSTLHLLATVPAPSTTVFERVRARLAEEVSKRLNVRIYVRIEAWRRSRPEIDPDVPIVDSSNRTAWLLLDRLAEGKIEGLNPIVIFGPPGCGKSHLVRCFQRKTNIPVSLWHGLEFHAAFARARRTRTHTSLRKSLLGTRLFVLDELHRLRGKRLAQKELGLLLEEFVAREVQVITISRHHPHEIEHFDRTLASRLLAGFVVEVQPPTLPSRKQFLRQLGISLATATPELERLVQGARSYHELAEGAREIEGQDRFEKRAGGPSPLERDYLVKQLLSRVANCFGIDVPDIEVGEGGRRSSLPRHVAAFVAVRSGIPAAELARRFGWRSASSVAYAVERVQSRMADDPEFRRLVDRCL